MSDLGGVAFFSVCVSVALDKGVAAVGSSVIVPQPAEGTVFENITTPVSENIGLISVTCSRLYLAGLPSIKKPKYYFPVVNPAGWKLWYGLQGLLR